MHHFLAIAALAVLGAVAPGEPAVRGTGTYTLDQTFVIDVYAIPAGDILGAESGVRIPAARAGQQKRAGSDQVRAPVRAPRCTATQGRTLETDLPSCGMQFRNALCTWTTATPPPFLHV